MRLFRPLLAEVDLTEQQWRVLRALTARVEAGAQAPEVGELAADTSLLAPSLSRILANLEHRELIRRMTAPHDQRRSVISLTPAGRALVARVAPHSEAIYQRIEATFGSDRLRHLLDELAQLAHLELSEQHTEERPKRHARHPDR